MDTAAVVSGSGSGQIVLWSVAPDITPAEALKPASAKPVTDGDVAFAGDASAAPAATPPSAPPLAPPALAAPALAAPHIAAPPLPGLIPLVPRTVLFGHAAPVLWLSPCSYEASDAIASLCRDGHARVWDPADGRCLVSSPKPLLPAAAVAVAAALLPGGTHAVIAGAAPGALLSPAGG